MIHTRWLLATGLLLAFALCDTGFGQCRQGGTTPPIAGRTPGFGRLRTPGLGSFNPLQAIQFAQRTRQRARFRYNGSRRPSRRRTGRFNPQSNTTTQIAQTASRAQFTRPAKSRRSKRKVARNGKTRQEALREYIREREEKRKRKRDERRQQRATK